MRLDQLGHDYWMRLGARRWFLRAAAVLAAFLSGLAYLYYPLLLNGMVSGDWADARLQIAILQSWSNCLLGHGDCLSPNYFFPTTGTLGYNDAYLVSGVLYHTFRRLGLDPYLAYEAVYVIVRLVGFLSVIALGATFLRLRFALALLAATLWLISINTYNQVGHTQLLYGGFVPLGLLLLLHLLRTVLLLDAEADGAPVWRAHIAALGLSGLALVWALTAFYSLFFFALFGTLLLALYLLRRRGEAVALVRAVMRHPSVIATLVASASLTPLALVVVYGTALKETGGHPWFSGHYPRPIDLLNVGPDDLIWSPLLNPLYQRLAGVPLELGELSAGYPVLLLVGFVTCLIWLAMRRAGPSQAGDVPSTAAPQAIAFGLAIAAAIMMLAVLRYGGGYSPWKLVWLTVPGARAINVPGRFLLFLTPVVCLVVAYGLGTVLEKCSSRSWRGALVAGLAVLLLVEQISVRPPFGLNRREELNFLATIPSPPRDCRAFFVTSPRIGPTGTPVLDNFYAHAVDAMLIAAMIQLPTVNGMASFLPKNGDLTRPFDADYLARVRSYADAHGLVHGLCSFDLKARRWTASRE
jgi:hypothetical protein